MTNTSIHHIIKPTDLIPSSSSIGNEQDTPQNHQYECIPEYLLTMTRHRPVLPPPSSIACHRLYHPTSSASYTNFSRVYLTPNTSDSSQCTCSSPPSAMIVQEESSTPLLTRTLPKESHRRIEPSSAKSMVMSWKRKSPSSTAQQRPSFLSQLRKSSLL